MQSYTVHEAPHPAADRIDRAENLVFIKDGFSWSAMFFTPIWLLLQRLWWAFLAYVIVMVALQVAANAMGAEGRWLSLIGLGISILFGFEAGTLRRWALSRRGWQMVGTASGRSLDDCERRFFEQWLPSQPILAPMAAGMRSSSSTLTGSWGGLSSFFGSRS